jgi:hypothetical protein
MDENPYAPPKAEEEFPARIERKNPRAMDPALFMGIGLIAIFFGSRLTLNVRHGVPRVPPRTNFYELLTLGISSVVLGGTLVLLGSRPRKSIGHAAACVLALLFPFCVVLVAIFMAPH